MLRCITAICRVIIVLKFHMFYWGKKVSRKGVRFAYGNIFLQRMYSTLLALQLQLRRFAIFVLSFTKKKFCSVLIAFECVPKTEIS